MKLVPLTLGLMLLLAPGAAAAAASPAAVADSFAAALKSGDAAALEALLAPDVFVAENGNAERSFAEYAGHHMPADIAFSKAVSITVKDRRVFESGSLATVVTESVVEGTYRDKPVHSRMMETLTLEITGNAWRIVHIHWSSAKLEAADPH